MNKKYETFYTVTNENTINTNDRSRRYKTLEAAQGEASSRLNRGKTEGVYILKAIQLVERKPSPVQITGLSELSTPMTEALMEEED